MLPESSFKCFTQQLSDERTSQHNRTQHQENVSFLFICIDHHCYPLFLNIFHYKLIRSHNIICYHTWMLGTIICNKIHRVKRLVKWNYPEAERQNTHLLLICGKSQTSNVNTECWSLQATRAGSRGRFDEEYQIILRSGD